MPRASRRRRLRKARRHKRSARIAINSDLIQCWCGSVGPYEEMFDDAVFSEGCQGTGWLDCMCGGDFCVCHNHGDVECPGCDDCNFGDEYDDHGYDDEDY